MPVCLEAPKIEIFRPDTVLKPRDTDGKSSSGKKRIVLVSPFPAFNIAFETYLKQLDKNLDIDEINEASIPDYPYFNAAKHEHEKGVVPAYIVDFFRIISREGENKLLREFHNYFEWAAETIPVMHNLKTRYLLPHPMSQFGAYVMSYELDKPFDPYSFKPNGFIDLLKKDLEGIVRGAGEADFNIFAEIVPKKEYRAN